MGYAVNPTLTLRLKTLTKKGTILLENPLFQIFAKALILNEKNRLFTG